MSGIFQLFHDLENGLFTVFGDILVFLYGLTHNLVLAIAGLTAVVLLPFTPVISKSVHNSFKQAEKMQKIHPELKRIKEEFKGDRLRQNQEMQVLMSREKINPASGCLPMIPQYLILFIFYDFIRNIYHYQGAKHPKIAPLYINHASALYKNLVASQGHLLVFGMDLSQKIPLPTFSNFSWIPYWILVIIGGFFSYVQFQRMQSRMPKNPQISASTQKNLNYLMPFFMVFVYFIVPVGVGVYYATSAIVRLGQYEFVFWRSPVLSSHKKEKVANPEIKEAKREKSRPLGNDASEQKRTVAHANGARQSSRKTTSKRIRKGR